MIEVYAGEDAGHSSGHLARGLHADPVRAAARAAGLAPLHELSMMLGVLYGARLLHEKVSLRRVAGVACMIAGVVALALA